MCRQCCMTMRLLYKVLNSRFHNSFLAAAIAATHSSASAHLSAGKSMSSETVTSRSPCNRGVGVLISK